MRSERGGRNCRTVICLPEGVLSVHMRGPDVQVFYRVGKAQRIRRAGCELGSSTCVLRAAIYFVSRLRRRGYKALEPSSSLQRVHALLCSSFCAPLPSFPRIPNFESGMSRAPSNGHALRKVCPRQNGDLDAEDCAANSAEATCRHRSTARTGIHRMTRRSME